MKGRSGKDMVSKIKKTKKKLQSFQETIINLQKFWSKKGCIILHNNLDYVCLKVKWRA